MMRLIRIILKINILINGKKMHKIIALIISSFIYSIADAGEIFITTDKNSSMLLTNRKPSNISDDKLIKINIVYDHTIENTSTYFLDAPSNQSLKNSADTKIPAKSETKKSIDLNLEKKVPDVQKKEKNTIKQKIDISSLL